MPDKPEAIPPWDEFLIILGMGVIGFLVTTWLVQQRRNHRG